LIAIFPGRFPKIFLDFRFSMEQSIEGDFPAVSDPAKSGGFGYPQKNPQQVSDFLHKKNRNEKGCSLSPFFSFFAVDSALEEKKKIEAIFDIYFFLVPTAQWTIGEKFSL
jgi:hypothetical protein